MRNTYILDTSVLVSDPSAYNNYPNSDVIIPVAVLSELDNLKKLSNEAGKNARVAIRLLDEVSETGNIAHGIFLENDITLMVDATYYDPSNPLFAGFGDPHYGDTKILYCAIAHSIESGNNSVILVSNDINLRVTAKSRKIGAMPHAGDHVQTNELYSGVQVVNDPDAGIELQQTGYIDPRLFGLTMNPHECVLFEDSDGNGIAMGRKVSRDKVKPIKKTYPWGISAKNKEQAFAIDLIMDKGIDLVTLIGKAGTGKSLIVLATALELITSKKYDKFVIYRPIQPVGNDIGYLPGTMEEKLGPWFQAIMDNFEFLLSAKGGNKNNWHQTLEMLQRKGQLEMEAITYIRGRSIPNSIILVDECQNLSREEVKTILTRAGEGTKIILTGDIEQIDNSGLDAANNGLTYIIEKFKESDLAGHVTLTQGERSRLASKAAEIL